jgi:cell division protease FtsH
VLVEDAHHEAWEILVEYRDVLDDMVLKLLDKETLGKEEIAEIFAPVVKRPERAHPTYGGKRPLSDRPPVLTPAELAVLGPTDLEDLARGRSGRAGSSQVRRRPGQRDGDGAGQHGGGNGSAHGNGSGNGSSHEGAAAAPSPDPGRVQRAAPDDGEPTTPSAPGTTRRPAPGTDPAS